MKRTPVPALSALAASLALGACSSAYYSFWEKFGYEKRDIFVERVEEARDSQTEAKEEFKTTLQRFQELTGAEGGELEDKYRQLKGAYDDCSSRAGDVRGRIDAVRNVAEDLFSEWEGEIEQIQNTDLKAQSQELLTDTRGRYTELMKKMEASEAKMAPVLTAFNDQVLFLKANLNARAISSLENTALEIENDVAALIADMDASIEEANEFIGSMNSEG